MRKTLMSQDLAKSAADWGIRYFLISFVDLFGVLRAKLVPDSAIGQMQRDGVAFAGFATHLDLTPPTRTCLRSPILRA
jgi:glutamine synthetase